MKIQESGEMYLETILQLTDKLEHVRSIDIANEMAFSKPSVSRAMTILKEAGHITMDKSGFINLTESGREIAFRIYERHLFLTECLVALGVDETDAQTEACRIEHVISQKTFEKIKSHIGKK